MNVEQPAKTVMVKVQVLLLPAASRAVQVTRFAPTGKNEPEGGTQLVETTPQLSVTLAAKNTRTEFEPNGALVLKLAGQVVTGACAPRTMILKEQLVVPAALLAVQLTTFVPTGKSVPEAGTQLTGLSDLTVNATTAPHWPGVLVVVRSGQARTGGFASYAPMSTRAP
jgi:hypothetical protein